MPSAIPPFGLLRRAARLILTAVGAAPSLVLAQAVRPAPAELGRPAEPVLLAAFEVSAAGDDGYKAANAISGTSFNTALLDLPRPIEVITAEFIEDIGAKEIGEALKYSGSISDNGTASPEDVTGNNFYNRGFQSFTSYRNGYRSFGVADTLFIDRVEIIKGPAALFFGQGSPGGVINYILKEPSFTKIPTTVTYTTGSDQKQKYLLDNNQALSKKVALRIVGSYENSAGERRFEYKKNNNVTGAVKVVPFDDPKMLALTFRAEWMENKYNQTRNNDWLYPDGWFQAYAAPTPALIAAAGLSANADPVTAYRNRILNPGGQSTWGNDMRIAANDFTLPTYTRVIKGAYYQDKNNQRIHDKAFNYDARGAMNKDSVNTTDITIESSPLSWLDARYVLTKDDNRYDSIEGAIVPYADGRRFNTLASATAGYYKKVTERIQDQAYIANITYQSYAMATTKKIFGVGQTKLAAGGSAPAVFNWGTNWTSVWKKK